MRKLDYVNYAVSEKEAGCDDIDMDDKGDRGDAMTGLIGGLVQGGIAH